MHRLLWIGLGVAVVLIGSVLALRPWDSGKPREERLIEQATSFVRDHKDVLASYLKDLDEGRVSKQPGFVTFYPPSITNASIAILGVTRDANGNTYFILKNSWVTFNVGIIKRKGGAELLGDQSEPNIVFTKQLLDEWWYYRAH